VRLAHRLVFSPVAADARGLQQHERQHEAAVGASLAMVATHWILEQQEPFNILPTEAGEAKI